jgi:hypothetical protein
VERNQTEVVSREPGDMAATFESDLELRNFFTWPWIPVREKRAVATEGRAAIGPLKAHQGLPGPPG